MTRVRLLDTAAAARRAGVSESLVRQWAHRGYLDPTTGRRVRLAPAGRVGRSPRYREADVIRAERATRINDERAGRTPRREWATRSA